MMTNLPFSWIEISLLAAFFGAIWVFFVDNTAVARRRALICSALAFIFSAAAWAEFAFPGGSGTAGGFRALEPLVGAALGIDGLNAPLLPLVSLLFLVTTAATLRTKIRRFSFARTLLLEVIFLLTLCARAPWAVILLLGLGALPVAKEMRTRGRSVRVFSVHLGASVLLLTGGWLLISFRESFTAGWLGWGYAMVAAGIAIRSGLVPAHCWVVDLFENAALGTSLVAMLPLVGVYAATRLLLPGAPETVLLVLTYLAAVSALYSAAMCAVQADARLFVCHLLLSQSSLVLAGIVLSTPLAMTAGLVLWLSVPLSVMGLGLTLRSLEARTGRLSLKEFQGLHVHTPTLAALFLITGLAAAGFPGTLAFFGLEMLTDAATRSSNTIGVLVVLSATLGGIAVLRAYGKLFLGACHRSTVNLGIRSVELAALLVLVALLVGGTLWLPSGVSARRHAAEELIDFRDQQTRRGAWDRNAKMLERDHPVAQVPAVEE